MKKQLLISIFLGGMFGLALLGHSVFAVFQTPTAVPPGANVATPINVSSVAQDKAGVLRVTGFRSFADAIFDTNVNITGKLTALGGVDPPYVSFSAETRETIRNFAKDVQEHEEAMLFWNGETRRMEAYVIGEDAFYTITGDLIEE
ncbi:MAG: hypothetical protein A3J30_02065 [Candidatus Wildermuthbacteria bacterium RIFCSPLOWO2_02_FULL_47_9c]|uniref:Uncharacterized protein n=2 Tax=Parcubacteria group TaxID=1794811 RepID=A0A837IK31_9BACT|nr:MAG: hypothetical protein UY25_C0007G0013 [Candidatus Yanofskybacteria bacterium GW2011_GWC1_48_11]KKW03539.1 MAG: hypothetical protein UY38_C0003G0013 [Parcubacteria group bacterium GW2011_GWB1_49_12]KKW08348.1 MAG: hypothetical protein UY45_C0008G0013 [Parcubacteria group bacterium GW2011_GWA1_49_26]KKW13549.1 MAG: hypothetical protein UY53_C0011G0014 [Parcubacteria group bacterium GW2011_GWA2_50_10]OHA60944.1 MAG: hypothetical protein A2109_01865 [Candidatus Wildermuthbacteria bacterium G